MLIKNPNSQNQKQILLEMQDAVKVYKSRPLCNKSKKYIYLMNFIFDSLIYFDRISVIGKEISQL